MIHLKGRSIFTICFKVFNFNSIQFQWHGSVGEAGQVAVSHVDEGIMYVRLFSAQKRQKINKINKEDNGPVHGRWGEGGTVYGLSILQKGLEGAIVEILVNRMQRL